MLFCHLLIYFKINFLKKILSGIPSEFQTVWTLIRFAGSDLGQNCLSRSSADDTATQRVIFVRRV